LPERNQEDVSQAVEKFHYPGNLSLGPDYLLSPEELRRLNEEPDWEFFRTPCFAYHVDSAFRERLTGNVAFRAELGGIEGRYYSRVGTVRAGLVSKRPVFHSKMGVGANNRRVANWAFVWYMTAEVYRKEITSGSKVLDLCSSFDSHLPPPTSLYVAEVIGHGLSDAELCANPRLSRCFNLDLNSTTDSARFPLENAEVCRRLAYCGNFCPQCSLTL
jgi:hypothetical protein